jgi:hypothetical protein
MIMICIDRHPFGLVAFRVLPAVVVTCGAVWACVRVTDDTTGPGADHDLGAEVRRGQELDDQARVLMERILAKSCVAFEVRDGRLGLLEAAARFRDLDRTGPGFRWDVFRWTYPGTSDDERHCREVIAFVRAQLVPPPAEPAAPLEDRLEVELCELLKRGAVHLPGSETAADELPGS